MCECIQNYFFAMGGNHEPCSLPWEAARASGPSGPSGPSDPSGPLEPQSETGPFRSQGQEMRELGYPLVMSK